MVWKVGSTDRSIVVMAKDFRSTFIGRSFERITRSHPKGWLWIDKLEMLLGTVRCLSCLLKKLKFKLAF
jgi:hypothetical protein